MSFITKMLNLQLMLFALILVGMLLSRLGIITKVNRKNFSSLLVNIVLPCNIVHSFLGELEITESFFLNCILALIISAVIQIVSTYGSRLVFRRYEHQQKSVCSYGMICSNSSFIGLPIAEALYGNLGVLYTSIFQIPIRFTMWSAGLALFTATDRKAAIRKLVKHPCIIAVAVGFIFMLLQVRLPVFIDDTITAISRCTTPLSMFVIGAILADADFRTIFNRHTIYFSFLRLIAYPLLVYAVLYPFNLDPLLVSISVIMTGMPAGSTTSILAEQYGCDSLFAAQIIFVSTLFSIFTIPLLGMLL